MLSSKAKQDDDTDGLSLGEFETYVLRRLSKFTCDWLKHQREMPEAFPNAISLEEWWSDFSEFMESHVREAMVAEAVASPAKGVAMKPPHPHERTPAPARTGRFC